MKIVIKARRDNSFLLASTINRVVKNAIDGGVKSDLFKFKRTCKRICTVLPKRNHSPRTHRSCNVRTSHNKTSSKCSDTSASDPDGASYGDIPHINIFSVSAPPITTFDGASSVEVVK